MCDVERVLIGDLLARPIEETREYLTYHGYHVRCTPGSFLHLDKDHALRRSKRFHTPENHSKDNIQSAQKKTDMEKLQHIFNKM
jgi:hypothetical protein